MNKLLKSFIEALRDLGKLDKATIARELRELFHYIQRQAFNQIPGISAIAALAVGAWVAGTFTTSRFKGLLASWGVIKGGTRVVSATTYKFLSFSLPVLAAGLTVYVVQRAMKAYRENELKKNMDLVGRLGEKVQAEIQEKLNILEKAKEAELISASEYSTKKTNLYQAYSKTYPARIQEFIIKKLAN